MSFFPSIPMGKKTPYYKYKEQEKHKKQREDDESAKVYQDFVESFEVRGSGEMETEFVKGETLLHGSQSVEKGQTISFHSEKVRKRPPAPAFLPVTSESHPVQVPSSPSTQKRHGTLSKGEPTASRRTHKHKPKHIDLMLETIKREQEVRESRLRPRKSGFDRAAEKLPDMSVSGSLDIGDSATTNLYVGNIAPDVNEDILRREFGCFGTVASVKIMWPRDEDQIKRGSNVGFVAFMVPPMKHVAGPIVSEQDRDSAARCIEKLNGEKLHGLELRIGWGKSVPLPASASQSGAQTHEAQPSAMPTELALGGKEDLEQKAVDVVIPSDLHLRYVIDTMAAYVVKDGAKFEQLIRQREAHNPAFAFLTDDSSAANVYYRWKLFTLVQGDSMQRWRLEPFYMIEGGPEWKPPNMCVGDGSRLTAAQRGEGMIKRKLLSELESQRFEEMLRHLTADKGSICDAMVFALNNAEAAEEVVEILGQSLCERETPVGSKIARLFVVSDILHNSSASVRNASQYRMRLGEKLPDVFESFQIIWASLQEKKEIQETVKKYVLKILRVWRNWYIFSNDYLNGLQMTFLTPVQSAEEIAKHLKKLEDVPDDDIERKCRFNGLSLRGGAGEQRLRCARLEAYLHGTSDSEAVQKKQKTTKTRRSSSSQAQKREQSTKSKKHTEPKISSWVSVESEADKKPIMPVSQWLQTKQVEESKDEEMKAVSPKEPKPPSGAEDIDMFEADAPPEGGTPMEGVEMQSGTQTATGSDSQQNRLSGSQS